MKKALMIMYMAVAASTAQAQSPLSFYAEAGIGTSRLYGKHSCCDTRIACKAGIGAKYDVKLDLGLTICFRVCIHRRQG